MPTESIHPCFYLLRKWNTLDKRSKESNFCAKVKIQIIKIPKIRHWKFNLVIFNFIVINSLSFPYNLCAGYH